MPSHWREISRTIISATIARVGLDRPYELKQALHDAYPFGERAYHPYKIWLSEIKRQMKKRDDGELFNDCQSEGLFKNEGKTC